jgi:23S rRNA (cytosine1962-C5)-methyltransferase
MYALLDSGDEKKWEQFGPFRVVRQAAQAYWPSLLEESQWNPVHARHIRSRMGGGHWEYRAELPERWSVQVGSLRFLIKLTDFGHAGVFPEQSESWQWIGAQCRSGIHVLNLFGYTGGSSLAAARAGADVTHVDASRGVVAWARENAELNGLSAAPMRWIVDDVQKFVARELRRGTIYRGMVLDPPSYGRGGKGETWSIERDLVPLLAALAKLLHPEGFLLLSCHTPGFSALVLANLLARSFPDRQLDLQSGEMVIPIAGTPLSLPSGSYARFAVRTAAPLHPQE